MPIRDALRRSSQMVQRYMIPVTALMLIRRHYFHAAATALPFSRRYAMPLMLFAIAAPCHAIAMLPLITLLSMLMLLMLPLLLRCWFHFDATHNTPACRYAGMPRTIQHIRYYADIFAFHVFRCYFRRRFDLFSSPYFLSFTRFLRYAFRLSIIFANIAASYYDFYYATPFLSLFFFFLRYSYITLPLCWLRYIIALCFRHWLRLFRFQRCCHAATLMLFAAAAFWYAIFACHAAMLFFVDISLLPSRCRYAAIIARLLLFRYFAIVAYWDNRCHQFNNRRHHEHNRHTIHAAFFHIYIAYFFFFFRLLMIAAAAFLMSFLRFLSFLRFSFWCFLRHTFFFCHSGFRWLFFFRFHFRAVAIIAIHAITLFAACH